MPATYEKHGLKFLYPENWKLTDGHATELPFHVEVETPSGGVWSVNVYPNDFDSDKLLAEAVAGIEATYDDVEVSQASPEFEDVESKGVDTYFYCLDFLVMARVRVIEAEEYKLVMLYQAESRDFDQHLEVFRAITTSLLKSTQLQ